MQRTQELRPGDFLYSFSDVIDNAVICGQKHGEFLGFSQGFRVLQPLSDVCSSGRKQTTRIVFVNILTIYSQTNSNRNCDKYKSVSVINRG